MFLLLDVRGTGLGSAEFAQGLHRTTGVSVLDAASFGAADGFVRLSFGAGEELLSEGCRRIAGFVAGLSNQ